MKFHTPVQKRAIESERGKRQTERQTDKQTDRNKKISKDRKVHRHSKMERYKKGAVCVCAFVPDLN